MSGFIKDHRKELQSDVWLMPPLYHRLWQYLKYKANFEDAEIPMHDGSRFKIKKGQHLTSVRGISQALGWYEGRKWKEPNPKTVSVILDWMIKTEMIEINRGKGNREYTLITLIKWEEYQHKESKGNGKETVDGTAREQQADIKKKNKEELKNDKEQLKDINKIKYAENVLLTPDEYNKLETKYGEPLTKQCIDILDNYKGALGKKYISDYRAMLNWVVKRAIEESNPSIRKSSTSYTKGGEKNETHSRIQYGRHQSANRANEEPGPLTKQAMQRIEQERAEGKLDIDQEFYDSLPI